jgi:hypothetical protein
MPLNQPVKVYGLNDAVPVNYQDVGRIKIGDSGFSVDCGCQSVLEKAKKLVVKWGKMP